MLNKGIQPETLRELIIDLGISKSKKLIPMDKVYAINRRVWKNCEALSSNTG